MKWLFLIALKSAINSILLSSAFNRTQLRIGPRADDSDSLIVKVMVNQNIYKMPLCCDGSSNRMIFFTDNLNRDKTIKKWTEPQTETWCFVYAYLTRFVRNLTVPQLLEKFPHHGSGSALALWSLCRWRCIVPSEDVVDCENPLWKRGVRTKAHFTRVCFYAYRNERVRTCTYINSLMKLNGGRMTRQSANPAYPVEDDEALRFRRRGWRSRYRSKPMPPPQKLDVCSPDEFVQSSQQHFTSAQTLNTAHIVYALGILRQLLTLSSLDNAWRVPMPFWLKTIPYFNLHGDMVDTLSFTYVSAPLGSGKAENILHVNPFSVPPHPYLL